MALVLYILKTIPLYLTFKDADQEQILVLTRSPLDEAYQLFLQLSLSPSFCQVIHAS